MFLCIHKCIVHVVCVYVCIYACIGTVCMYVRKYDYLNIGYMYVLICMYVCMYKKCVLPKTT